MLSLADDTIIMVKYNVTTVQDVDALRRKSMVTYSVMMGFRLACILVCFIIPLQWVWIPALFAVFIPMLATVSTTMNKPKQAEELVKPENKSLSS